MQFIISFWKCYVAVKSNIRLFEIEIRAIETRKHTHTHTHMHTHDPYALAYMLQLNYDASLKLESVMVHIKYKHIEIASFYVRPDIRSIY